MMMSCGDLSLSDDLITEILLRLPVKSFFRFKAVSKPWNFQLSDPRFVHTYRLRNAASSSSLPPLLGFFQFKESDAAAAAADAEEEHRRSPSSSSSLSFLATCGQGMPVISNGFPEKLGFFFACSGGLIVCGTHPTNYYVCNPVTGQYLPLPQPNNGGMPHDVRHSIGFHCKEQGETNCNSNININININSVRLCYKVVRADFKESNCRQIKIQMYSSEIGGRVWREFMVSGAIPFTISPRFNCTSVKDGTFLWFSRGGSIAAYHPETAADDRMWLIRYPFCSTRRLPTLGQTTDGHLLCAMDNDTPGFKIYVLDEKLPCYPYSTTVSLSEWKLRHVVRVEIPGLIWYHPPPNVRELPPSNVDQIHPRRIAFDSQCPRILYLRMGDGIFLCDTENGQVDLLSYQGTLLSSNSGFKLVPYPQSGWPTSLLLL